MTLGTLVFVFYVLPATAVTLIVWLRAKANARNDQRLIRQLEDKGEEQRREADQREKNLLVWVEVECKAENASHIYLAVKQRFEEYKQEYKRQKTVK